MGDIALRIPKLREGSYFPSLLEPRRRAERALLAVVQQAYIQGVSTRKVDDLVQTIGLSAGVDKSAVSRICRELDEIVAQFRQRPLAGAYPYLWLDALYLKVRQYHRIVSQAMEITVGVRETGERDVLGFAVGAGEEEAFWREFLRGVVGRGLQGVQLVVSDAYEGLKAALGGVFSGASWQRCRVHSCGTCWRGCPNATRPWWRRRCAPSSRSPTGTLRARSCGRWRASWRAAGQLLLTTEDDVLAYMAFPREHWTRLYSTNVLERLNREVKRRTDVVRVFPDVPAVERLVGAVLLELNDEWQVERRYFSQESMHKLLTPETLLEPAAVAPRLAPVR